MGKRNIVLFSDGTGNSSSKLQKTNVWRMYEALDLGDPARPNQREQVAYYDDGVGNSSFRLLAILGGVFGWGLARNVRELYTFLCRHYREGDRIYAFGYSRGSYTIRLLVAMIAQFGPLSLTRPDPDNPGKVLALTEAELDLQVRDVWRAFRREFHTNHVQSDFLVMLVRYLREVFLVTKRRLTVRSYASPFGPEFGDCSSTSLSFAVWLREWRSYWRERKQRKRTGEQYSAHTWTKARAGARHDIRFVGVFDTVAAYGGPITEITRAIDDWFWPLSMPDYRLNPRVEEARHALALDDKRGSFQPLLWDEVFERANPSYDPERPRLRQVWFAGMHSDVGGGYSDESLSYVPLYWMLEHAERAGLHFIPHMRHRIEHYANPHGKMHDSRRGLGSFYRYQPRYINAWVDKRNEAQLAPVRAPFAAQLAASDTGKEPPPRFVKPDTGVFRDQVIDGGRYRHQGFLVQPVLVHKDTIRRIRAQSDGYAPINLIRELRQDDGIRGTSAMPGGFDTELEYFSQMGTRIRIRRFWYFVTMLLLTVLIAPAVLRTISTLLMDGATCSTPATSAIGEAVCTNASLVLPDTLAVILGQMLFYPWLALALTAALLLSTGRGRTQENLLGDIARNNWSHAQSNTRGARSLLPGKSALFNLANWLKRSPSVQAFLTWLKWSALPFLLGILTWMGILAGFIGLALWAGSEENRCLTRQNGSNVEMHQAVSEPTDEEHC